MKRPLLYLIVLFIIGIFFYSCSTKKNTSLSRFYHNTTAHFNIFFNGAEYFRKAMNTIEDTPEDYTQQLPIFKSEREDIQSTVSADMDESVKKAVKMIKMHSITVKPERKKSKRGSKTYKLTDKDKEFYAKSEYNKWVDDAYLLIGKAHYYKGDYRGGLRSLHVILNKFRKEEVRFYALYWIARSYAAMKDFNEATNYLSLLKEEKTIPKDLKQPIELLHADIFLKQKKYDDAVEKLEYAVTITKKKKKKARIKYILAQVYQKIERGDEALKLYAEVIKMDPPYEMAFNAKINMAKSYLTGKEGSEQIKKMLEKLLKDDKNIDFQDQIYYVFAGVEHKEGNIKNAIEYYKKSVQKSVSNQNQKALSYLELADIYFEKRSYLKSGSYYDSTMSVLDKNYPDFDIISKKAYNLKDLTDNLKLIAREDSLQKIAVMDSNKRTAYIKNIIEQIIREEKAELNKGYVRYNPDFDRQDYSKNPSKGKWYFYNTQAISIGKSEFSKLWGKRKLEDHWRRKNKQIIGGGIEEEVKEDSVNGRITNNKKVEFYLQDLPLTDSLLKISDKKIARAYFDAGVIYERRMEDYPEAEKSYKTLIKRFPSNSLNVEALFNMYLMHYNNTGNKGKAEVFRKEILSKYPHSKYAKILSDPNYLKKLKENKDVIDKLYEEAYFAYKQGKYNLVISKTEESFKVSEQNHLESKFIFLKAMAKGNLGYYKEMEQILVDLTEKYPDDEISPRANDVLKLLESGKYDPDYYLTEKDNAWYYTVTCKTDSVANKIKYILTTFNVIKFPDKNLKSELYSIGEYKAITVKVFADDQSALNYLRSIVNNGNFKEIANKDYDHFVISNTNSEKLMKLPIIEKYLKFYSKHYQSGIN